MSLKYEWYLGSSRGEDVRLQEVGGREVREEHRRHLCPCVTSGYEPSGEWPSPAPTEGARSNSGSKLLPAACHAKRLLQGAHVREEHRRHLSREEWGREMSAGGGGKCQREKAEDAVREHTASSQQKKRRYQLMTSNRQLNVSREVSNHTVEYDPFVKSQLASRTQL